MDFTEEKLNDMELNGLAEHFADNIHRRLATRLASAPPHTKIATVYAEGVPDDEGKCSRLKASFIIGMERPTTADGNIASIVVLRTMEHMFPNGFRWRLTRIGAVEHDAGFETWVLRISCPMLEIYDSQQILDRRATETPTDLWTSRIPTSPLPT